MARRRPTWDKDSVRALRRHLGLTQEELAQQMGTRQQTISEWETGMYAPRGVSERMLGMVAEQAGFAYAADGEPAEQGILEPRKQGDVAEPGGGQAIDSPDG
jgi:transcriptional regulator with XRE-family HTH domain